MFDAKTLEIALLAVLLFLAGVLLLRTQRGRALLWAAVERIVGAVSVALEKRLILAIDAGLDRLTGHLADRSRDGAVEAADVDMIRYERATGSSHPLTDLRDWY